MKPFIHVMVLQNPNNTDETVILRLTLERPIKNQYDVLKRSSCCARVSGWSVVSFCIAEQANEYEKPRLIHGQSPIRPSTAMGRTKDDPTVLDFAPYEENAS